VKRKITKTICCAVLASSLLSVNTMADENVTLYAAGSLKAALGEVAENFNRSYNMPVNTKFSPSGLLRKSIEAGEHTDLFASANMKHPLKLSDQGWGEPVALFARNKLCAVAQPGLDVSSETLLDTLLNQSVRVGTSTPKADPSGDYAWELFAKADALVPGSFKALSTKALTLTGGPNSTKAPQGRNQYGWVMSEKQADIFLTYCTNAVLAQKDTPELKIVQVPEALSVGADYGLIVNKNASVNAWKLAMYILSPEGQKVLKQYGFDAAAIPKTK